jgi:hypothetical protein
LENLVARIDTPRLRDVYIRFFTQPHFNIVQLSRLIAYAGIPQPLNSAKMSFKDDRVEIRLRPRGATHDNDGLQLVIPIRDLNRKVSSMTQICNQALSLLSGVEQLDIVDSTSLRIAQATMDNRQWLELFQPFISVRTLCISRQLLSFIVPALQELTGENTIEVLPALNDVYLEGYEPSDPEHQTMEPFIAARRRFGRPVVVHPLERTSLRS